MTAPTTTPSDNFYDLLARLHGHRCPMSIMGARLGLAAAAAVGRHGKDGDVTALFMHRNCALDGIQLALGTTLGNGNIKVDPQGLPLLEATNADTKKRVRVTLTERALALGKRYGELRRAGTGDAERQEILLTLQLAPDADVVEVAMLEAEGRCCR